MIYCLADWSYMFKNISSAIDWIESQVKYKPKTDLSRMQLACLELGNPQNDYKVIHIAGTNGKGSVASYITTVLMKKYSVGRFTSPYIIKFNERISINLEMIDDIVLLQYINFIYDYNESFYKNHQERLSFFELITLISMLYFRDQQVDYVVLEVGVGGLLDSTNVVKSALALITNIGFDHMQTLGHSLSEIAANKLGIVKDGTPLITTVDESLKAQFKAHAESVSSEITFIDEKDFKMTSLEPIEFKYEFHRYQLSLGGLHQVKNAVLAIKAINFIDPKMPLQQIKEGIKETVWPGRFETVSDKPLVIIDGAHNTHGMKALLNSIDAIYKDKKKHFIFCAMADKETKQMLDMISAVADSVTLTHFDYKRVSSLETLVNETTCQYRYAYNDAQEAIEKTMAGKGIDDVIIITGSLYFISQIRPYFI